MAKIRNLFVCFRPMEKFTPNGARRFLFPTNPDLADMLGRTDVDFDNFSVWDFLEAPNLWVRCRRLFFSEKLPPYVWKPLICGYVAAGAENGPHIFGSP